MIDPDEGYPAPGASITWSSTYQWEWAKVYEWSVDMTQFGAAPIFVVTGSSHHSPAKGGQDDDDFPLSPDPLMDYGDLPAPYQTLRTDDGARHVIDPAGAYLGARVDSEPDGQPHPLALGDDLAGVDDEDGVELLTPLIPGTTAVVRVTIGGRAGYLSAFIDWDGDGTLDEVTLVSADGPASVTPGILGDTYFAATGVYDLTIEVPSDAVGVMPSRWRITNEADQGGNSPAGQASSGEVEDHIWPVAIGDWVWFDANQNGIQDPGEIGLDGVTVNLYQVTNGVSQLVATTETADGGHYLFENLPGGHYFVEVVPPPDFVFSPHHKGDDPDLDSDADPETGAMAVTALYPGQADLSWDAGLHIKPTLAVISAVRSRIEDGVAVISWDVALEIDTVGYYLERWVDGDWLRISETLIESRFWEVPPITYEQTDPGAPLGTTQRYRIVELDGYGRLLTYGPYDLKIDGGEVSYETWAAGIDWGDADASPEADPDGDGLTNWQEYLAGTDPLDANSVLRVTRILPLAGGVELTWASEPGRTYAIEKAPAPNGPFMAIETAIPAAEEDAVTRYVIPVDPGAVEAAYFRVVVGKD